jgi:hypothetical protein
VNLITLVELLCTTPFNAQAKNGFLLFKNHEKDVAEKSSG